MSQGQGEMQLIFGPMFSGKSTELLRRIRRHTIAKRKCLVVKYANDTRYSKDNLATHDRMEWVAQPATTLREVLHVAQDYDVIGIDEGQFFPDIDLAEKLANQGKTVIVAALDGTFQRKPFGKVLELIPLAEDVTKLTAVCMICQNDAPFSLRLGSETQVQLIGGADKYIAVCRKCFKANNTHNEEPSEAVSN